MSREESCDFCGGNCGQCGSSHPGGPPSMARMASNLSRGSDVRDVRLTYKEPKQKTFDVVDIVEPKNHWLYYVIGIVTGAGGYELIRLAMS